jgi:hypothetical protein
MLDEHRRETFLVLDFHRIEHASIGINPDKELLCRFEITQRLDWIGHNSFDRGDTCATPHPVKGKSTAAPQPAITTRLAF